MSNKNAHIFVSEQMETFLRALTLSPDHETQYVATERLREEREKQEQLRKEAQTEAAA